MGWFDGNSKQASHHEQWNNTEPREHDPSFVHELLAGAASYEEREGNAPSHEKAKEIMAGFAGAFIDHIENVPRERDGW
ncbi:hypothetical protein N7494_005120 [Penicillium frequentans]|uniref:Uncharacterized protein n=1 Tax=Penicillium frequentans TaxID=3151616 RepID=A0AAD6GH88_9EURO|nr:hypothetical protein N7494_005120 [Penicillium glabrum]